MDTVLIFHAGVKVNPISKKEPEDSPYCNEIWNVHCPESIEHKHILLPLMYTYFSLKNYVQDDQRRRECKQRFNFIIIDLLP